MRRALCVVLFLLAWSAVPAPAPGQSSVNQPAFDPEAATEAYLAQVPPDVRTRSDSYFEGGEWLLLWDFLAAMAVAALFLGTGLSASLRDRIARLTRFRPVQTFPLTFYESFSRERTYGLLNLDFGGWLRDQIVSLLMMMILGGLAVTVLYAVFRWAPRTWWIWGAAVSLIFLVLLVLIAPVFILPLFYKSTELTDEKVRGPILALARQNGVETNHVWVLGVSKESNRVGANVSGL